MNTLLEPLAIREPQVSLSPLRAAGFPLMKTLVEPSATRTVGECFSHLAVLAVASAALRPLMNTSGEQPGRSIWPLGELDNEPRNSPAWGNRPATMPTSNNPPKPRVQTLKAA